MIYNPNPNPSIRYMMDLDGSKRFMLVQLRKKVYDEPPKDQGFPRVELIATAYDPGTSADYICTPINQLLVLYNEYGGERVPAGEIGPDGKWKPEQNDVEDIPPQCCTEPTEHAPKLLELWAQGKLPIVFLNVEELSVVLKTIHKRDMLRICLAVGGGPGRRGGEMWG